MSRRSGRLRARTVATRSLDGETRAAMWALFGRYYAGATPEAFERDLRPKAHVILLRDSGDGSLQGFSTIDTYAQPIDGRPCVVVYSGDTVVEQDYWGQTALQRAFYRFLLRTKARHPLTPVFWFLITKGYKTYLLMTRNVPHHFPRWDRPTPAWEARVIDTLARAKFPARWDPEAGVLRLEAPECRLKSHVAAVDAHALEGPDVRFFVERNPGHPKGEELCCIGEVDGALLWGFAAKQLRRAVGSSQPRARRSAGTPPAS